MWYETEWQLAILNARLLDQPIWKFNVCKLSKEPSWISKIKVIMIEDILLNKKKVSLFSSKQIRVYVVSVRLCFIY